MYFHNLINNNMLIKNNVLHSCRLVVMLVLLSITGALAQNVVFEGPCATATRRQNGDIIMARQYVYTGAGLLDSMTETERGNLQGVTRYTYGDGQRRIREEFFNRNNDLESTVLFSYQEGQLIERSERERDRLQRYINYVYDSADRLTRELVYNRGDDLIQRNEYTYDGSNERVVRQERFNEDDRLLETLEYFYDESGNLTLRTRSNRGGDLVDELEYSYDESGNITTLRRREGRQVITTTYDYSCFE